MVTTSPSEIIRETLARAIAMDAPLNARLSLYSKTARRLRPELAAAVEALIGRLERSGAGGSAPRPGEPMPGFCLPGRSGELVSLDEVVERGPVAVIFHRGHWCPYCRITARAVADAQERIAKAGGQVVTISPERRGHAGALLDEAGARYPILSDPDNGYALSLGLAFWVGPEIERFYGEIGWNLPAFQGSPGWMLPIPAAFVVDRNGIVREAFVDPDYRRRMEVDDLVAALASASGRA